ncbi:MAG: hypothetical protein GWP33_08405 [Alphaproteobacteria bacterium]|nr:hypothetical protein [Alphaproteobacteria bacterium]
MYVNVSITEYWLNSFIGDYMNEIDILRWVHILAMVYWLGGEWGVFQSSYNVVNHSLSMDERRRHMETAYRIDLLARVGITLMLPLGLQMGYYYGFVPFMEGWLSVMWLIFLGILATEIMAFYYRETDRGIILGKVVEMSRYIQIAFLLRLGVMALLNLGPVDVSGGYWYPAKMVTFAVMLIIGLLLRVVMREWTILFRVLAAGPNAEAEAQLDNSIGKARIMAYFYWVGIAGTGFLGAVKPF